MAKFHFSIEEVFEVPGIKGVFASGKVDAGRIDPFDVGCLDGDPSKEFRILRIEGPGIMLDFAQQGADVALLLEGATVDTVRTGDKITFVRTSKQ